MCPAMQPENNLRPLNSLQILCYTGISATLSQKDAKTMKN